MKFLCDNCKAKYQIADEKVAGKTVRMKCRKCGHQIEVRAAVTETSVSTSPPGANSGSDAPRAPAARSGLATSLSAAKPRAPISHGPAGTAGGGALAGAFQRTVQEGPQTVPFPNQNNPVELSVTDEWYVAINGVPVGPVRISELRRKAASGAVTEDSLCWQEGLEEWRPVRSIPELAAIVREAAQGNRPSLIAPPPSNESREGRGSNPPRAPQRQHAPVAPRATPEPPRASPSFEPAHFGQPAQPPRPSGPGRSNVVPLRVAAQSMDEVGPNTAPLGGAAAARAPSYSQQAAPLFAPQPQPQMQMQPAPLALDPFAVPPAPLAAPERASMLSQAAFSPSMLPPPPKRGGVPLWFWPILLFTGVFGAMAAFFVFKQQQQQPPVVIQLPATSAPTATEVKNDVPPPASGEPVPTSSTPSTGTRVAVAPKGGGGGVAAPPPRQGIDLGGLNNPSAGGPNVGASGPGAGPGGAGLDGSSVERVVASHRAGVKRTCWERGGADQKSSVNVTVSAQVGPAGNVVGTSSTGDDPVVGKCIEGQVRTWMFSAPGATTTVNIPFKFVRQ